jgi:hypothetical protein
MGLILVFIFCLINILEGAPAKESKSAPAIPQTPRETIISVQSKEIQGEVSALCKDFIAISYYFDKDTNEEKEVLLPLDKYLKVERKGSLAQIGVGDIVFARYEEVKKIDHQGIERLERVAKVISFIRAAEKKSESTGIISSEKPSEIPEEELPE